MKRVLVTGANGFVGRHLIDMLHTNGWSVRGAVRSTEALGFLSDFVEGHVVGSIDGETDWGAALDGVDVVVHLAARVHVLNDTVANPLEAYREVNVHGTRRLLEASVAAGVRRFVFMSSVKAAGESTREGNPFTEADECRPEDEYGITKGEAERLVLAAGRDGSIETVIIRPPMVYGPGVRANFLRLMRAVEVGIPLPLGSVRNGRSMVYVNNLADAVSVCMEHPNAADEVFFVADDEVLATSGLVAELARAMDKRPRLVPVPVSLLRGMGRIVGRSGEIERLTGSLVVSTDKIKRKLDWAPPWSVSEGIDATVAAHRRDRDSSEE